MVIIYSISETKSFFWSLKVVVIIHLDTFIVFLGGVFMKNLLIIGAGQYGMVAKEIAESMKCFEKIDFVDDVYPSAVGKICDIDKLIHEYDSAVVAIGNTELRLNLIKGLCEIGYEVPTLIHEKAYVSPSAKIGLGCFIEPMVVVHTAVSIETGCILSAGVILNHNSVFTKAAILIADLLLKLELRSRLERRRAIMRYVIPRRLNI